MRKLIAGVVCVATTWMSGCDFESGHDDSARGVKAPECVFTKGYWKTHANWPAGSLRLGAPTYSEAQLRAILGGSTKGNGLVDLAQQLIAAKLNVASGASSPVLDAAIARADALIGSRVVPPIGAGHLPPSTTGALVSQLDALNRGATGSVECTGGGADLAITKTVSNSMPTVGDAITYVVTVSNHGPGDATNVAVTDLVPAGLTFVSAAPSQGTYTPATGLWIVGTVPNGTTHTLHITAMPVTTSPLVNTAAITGADQVDPDPSNNTASVTIMGSLPQADLAVTKAVSDAAPDVGDTVTFTVTASNNGPRDATNVTITDLLPAGLIFVSATPSQGTYTPATGLWTLGTLTIAAPQTLQLTTVVVSAAPRTNTVAITGADQADPNPANNTASVTVTPALADLAVTKTVSDSRPNVGDAITFTVTLVDNGPGDATGVAVTDLLPVGLTFVSATPSQGTYSAATGLWMVGTVTTSSPQTLQLTAVVVSPASQTNTAVITDADQFDPATANNAASATVNARQADLAVFQSSGNTAPRVGDVISFGVSVVDNGPDDATNVVVTDLLPPGLAFVSATPSQGSYNASTGQWVVGTVTTSGPQTLVVSALVVSPSLLTNTAVITDADQFDPDPSNNAATLSFDATQADLAVIQSTGNTFPNVGDVISFSVSVIDNGFNDATSVVIMDLLPPGLTFVSATASQGSYNASTGEWIVGTVTTSSPQSLTLTARVVSAAAQTNTATITSADQFDPNPANNTASLTFTPTRADLAVTNTVSDATPNVGDAITFTVTLVDNGPFDATGVAVTDLLPVGLTFVSATPSQGTYSAATGLWMVGTLAIASPQTLQITAVVASADAQTSTVAITDSDQFDPDTANNVASATVTPTLADLALTKTVDDETPIVGGVITYTITVFDDGPDDATGVAVTDLLPAGLTFISAAPSQGSYNATTGEWIVGTVTTSAPQTLVITARVVTVSSLVNTATITDADQFDPELGNNTASATITP